MKKVKTFTWIVLGVNLLLLGVLVAIIIQSTNTPAPLAASSATSAPFSASSEKPSSPQSEDATQGMGGTNEQNSNAPFQQWIATMKDLAQKHQVDAFFLQELFPDNIVYNFRKEIIYAPIDKTLPLHSYNWDNLAENENGVRTYTDSEGKSAIFGIDVSKYQGDIDWEQVKEAGVGYVMLRVGYRGYDTGKLMLDEYFERYIEGATQAGLPIGVYFFSQAITPQEAQEEADFVLQAVAGYTLQYPVVFDMEEIETPPYRTENLTAQQITDIAIAFCARVQAGGHHPMIYGNVSWFLSKMELSRLTDYDKWFAQYRPLPYFPYTFTMWQYTHKGTVPGIQGNVDMNLCFANYPAKQ